MRAGILDCNSGTDRCALALRPRPELREGSAAHAADAAKTSATVLVEVTVLNCEWRAKGRKISHTAG